MDLNSNLISFSLQNNNNNTSPFGQAFTFGIPTAATTSPPRFSFGNSPQKNTSSEPKNVPPPTTKISDSSTSVAEQPAAIKNQEQDDAETPDTMAQQSLILKKINSTLRDPKALVVDREDPNSPLYAMSSFEELPLKPDLLKGSLLLFFVL